MSEPLKIQLVDLEAWLNQETADTIQSIKDEAKNLVKSIQDRVDGIRDSTERMLGNSEKELLKSSPKTYRKAKAASKMTQKVLDILDDTSIQNEISYDALQTLHKELEKMMSLIGQERVKWFRHMDPYFILDRRRFDIALRRAADAHQELHSFALNEYATAKEFEDAVSTIDRIVGMLDELNKHDERKKEIELRKAALDQKIEEEQQKIAHIKDQHELGKLSEVNEQIKALQEQVEQNLRYLQKPFLKLQSLIRVSKYSLPPKVVNKLNEYLETPFKAFSTEEENYPLLKGILKGMGDAINQKKLRLKSSRLRKAQDQMKAILYENTLDSLHQSCEAAMARKRQLVTSGTISTYRKELEQVQKDLQKLRKRRSLVHSRWSRLDTEHRKDREKIEALKSELEASVLSLTDKVIRVDI